MKTLFNVCLLAGFLFAFSGCNSESGTEQATEDVEKSLEETGERTEESLENAAEEVEESTEAAEDTININ